MVTFGFLFRYSYASFRSQLAAMRMVVPPSVRTRCHRLVDVVLFVTLAMSLSLIVYHKYQGHKIAFLLQPCHVLHMFLLVLFFCPRGSGTGALLFSLYLHLLWAPLLGLVAADLDVYDQRFELANWAFQHVMLLFVPLVWIATGKFPLYTGRSFFLLAHSTLTIFHFSVLLPVATITSVNLNYILCPPSTVPPVVWLGRWYRIPTTAACALLAWLLRYVFIEAFVRCIGGPGSSKKGSEKSCALGTPYADIELDESVIVTNSSAEARRIRAATAAVTPNMAVEVVHLHEARTITSLDRLPPLQHLVHPHDDTAAVQDDASDDDSDDSSEGSPTNAPTRRKVASSE